MTAYTLDDAQRDALKAAKRLRVPIMKTAVKGAYEFSQNPSRRVAHAPVLASWCKLHTVYTYEQRIQLGWMAAVTIEKLQTDKLAIDKLHETWLAVYNDMTNRPPMLGNAIVWLTPPILELIDLTSL